MPASRRALLVCSTDIHAEMFVPVGEELARRSWTADLVSLDRYYDQAATSRAHALGAPVVELDGPRRAGSARFYERSFVSIWRDVLSADAPVRSLLRTSAPAVVMVGNDYGLIEKLWIRRARQQGSATVLLQDGVLGRRSRPAPLGIRARVVRGVRALVSPALRLARLPHLAASNYGQSKVDLICASGPAGVDYFHSLGVAERRLAVTGQPRYDRLRRLARGLPDSADRDHVVFFSTPFAVQNLGIAPQERQERLIEALGAAMADAGGPPLLLKRHPRQAGLPAKNARVAGPVAAHEVLAESKVAILGISTVIEEAVMLGVPVIVPGQVVHEGRFEDFLPPADAFPRFESVDEAMRLLAQLRDPAYRTDLLARQRAHLGELLLLDEERSAAELTADAIERLTDGG